MSEYFGNQQFFERMKQQVIVTDPEDCPNKEMYQAYLSLFNSKDDAYVIETLTNMPVEHQQKIMPVIKILLTKYIVSYPDYLDDILVEK